ncbi:hypothetical protein HY498_00915 [Candidatus Woesearchaeota archaeon]|nr:hypothetical protein [Candidatus Woesearchaeota archaeon]
MKLPKKRNHFCPKCRKHTEHTVSIAKNMGRNKTHPMSRGSRARMRRRGQDRGFGNKGRTSKGAVSSFSMTGAKTSKKQDLRFTCSVCKKTSGIRKTFRAKKIELI